MSTRKMYYEDSHLAAFRATVLSCQPVEGGFAVVLDATAFYPEGGGQAADTGLLGGVRVLSVREAGEEVLHLCDGALDVGAEVEGKIDYSLRFARMQQHSGEHIVSGILHSLYGCHNTGFHMGADGMTIDFDTVIPAEDLPRIEAKANEAVWKNLPVKCWIPSPEELKAFTYRTKKDLPWPVRLVEFPGYDRCACCGTHVAATGEIGLIKLLSAVSFRGGTRIEMACGSQAFAILNEAYRQNKLVCRAFSAQPDRTGEAAQRMNEVVEKQKQQIAALERQLYAQIAAGCAGEALALRFQESLSPDGLRNLADAMADHSRIAAVFSGSDDGGYAFCLVSREEDLRPLGKALTAGLQGRGGGKSPMQQGRVSASAEEIRKFFDAIS